MVETMCWEVYLIWQKKIIENRDTTFNIPYLFLSKGDNFSFFYKFDKFEIDFWACFKWLISFLVFLCNTSMTNFDKHNNFNLRMRNSKIQWIKF